MEVLNVSGVTEQMKHRNIGSSLRLLTKHIYIPFLFTRIY